MSPNEWMTLLAGMEKGLHCSSVTGFYYLCRAVITKNEAELDRFDQVFLEFFEEVVQQKEIPAELMNWLNAPTHDLMRELEELKYQSMGFSRQKREEQLKMLKERLCEQDSEHNGGAYWVGTQGNSIFGNSGWRLDSLRVGGKSVCRTAILVAQERNYRDFRKDNQLDIRRFQMAFRLLRQLSAQNDSAEREVDVDGTVCRTCENAGVLNIQYKKPRKNAVKVLLLMDCGGSMEPYAGLCSLLFQAVSRANHFQDFRSYYFHNCIFGSLYKNPRMRRTDAIQTEWILNTCDSRYKVIIVGDALMSPGELMDRSFNWAEKSYGPSGLEWLERFRRQFPYLIWLNPEPVPMHPTYWSQTHYQLSRIFPMFRLSPEGLEKGVKQLMSQRRC